MSSAPGAAPLLLALAALWPATAFAYRPFDSTDAAVAATGELELELGPLGLLARGTDRSLVAPSLVVNWGLVDRLELVLEGAQAFGLIGGADRYRLTDLGLGLKRVLREGSLQGGGGPSVAGEAALLAPEIGGEPSAGTRGALIISQRWEEVAFHLNLQAAWRYGQRGPGLLAGAVAEGPERWPVRPVAELIAARGGGGAQTAAALAGAIWRVGARLSLDAAVRGARVGGARELELRAGFTLSTGPGA